jgi:hypothetical protein
MSTLDLPEPRPAVHESRCPECGSNGACLCEES